jgi:hypothetical protein
MRAVRRAYTADVSRCAAVLVALLGAACGPGKGWESRVEGKARAAAPPAAGSEKSILFGDLHVHTSYSWDGFLFTLPLYGGEGAHPPADACDFARYCSALDFYALTDHAEALRSEHWQRGKESVRECNARAGDPANPDLVAFMGFEWTQAGLTAEDHYGHRCVFFPGTDDAELPVRPVAAANNARGYAAMQGVLGTARWLQPQHWGRYGFALEHLRALVERPVCSGGDPADAGAECLEVAATPADLHRTLGAQGLEWFEIPHGTAWGVYTPSTSTLAKHLAEEQLDRERQVAIEIVSGHGNSEEYRRWRAVDPDGSCPAPAWGHLPCCWQAGEVMRARCGDLPGAECEARVERARGYAAQLPVQPQRVFPGAAPEEWLDCGQCRDCFKPAYDLRPLESVQYGMALANFAAADAQGRPLRFRYGFVGSTDIHDARAGAGYKQRDLTLMTDGGDNRAPLLERLANLRAPAVDAREPQAPGSAPIGLVGNDARVSDFLYAGGLAAVHSAGRSREAIWDALGRREVYATSGPRILLWFDLLDASGARSPMGSELELRANPEFEVRALGSFEQLPGCPEWAAEGLSRERLDWLCRGECYHPGERRRRIEKIEVIRIRPQVAPGEDVGALIEDPWRSYDCPPDPAGCSVRFSDPEFTASGRDALYYVRALEQPSAAINGKPLATRFDREGNAVSIALCGSAEAGPDCLGEVRERAWSSPIFANQPLACAIERSRPAALGSAVDAVVRESVSGPSCAQAQFEVEIRDAGGRPLYVFREPFATFFPRGAALRSLPPDLLRRQAWRFVNWKPAPGERARSDALPPYQPGSFAWDLGRAHILIERARYERLRAAGLPLVWHSAIGPAMRAVVYDARAGEAVALLDEQL